MSTARKILEDANNLKDVDLSIIIVKTKTGWNFNFSEMPIEFLCFARSLLDIAIDDQVRTITNGGIVKEEQKVK